MLQLYTPVSTCLKSQFVYNLSGMQTNSKAAASAHEAVNASFLAAASADPSPDSSAGIAVRAALLHAGLPNCTISNMFKYYPPYCKWDVDTKFHHSLKLWLQELGPEGLDAQLLRFPYILTRTPQQVQDVRLWLLSLGIDADKALRRKPRLVIYHLQGLQAKVDAFHAYNLPGLVSFVLRHPQALIRSPDDVYEMYNAVAELLDVDPASTDAAYLLNPSTSQRMFQNITAAEMKNRMSFFRQRFAASHATVWQALKYCVFLWDPRTMEERAQFLQKMLNLSIAELNKSLKVPQLLNHTPDHLQAHLESFHGLGFSQAHMKAMCLTRPVLLTLDMTSNTNVEKWNFLTVILEMTITKLAARPSVLTFFLANKLGPRHAFILQLLTSGAMSQHKHNAVHPLVYSMQSDVEFVDLLAKRLKTDATEYTISFKRRWQERWDFLRQQDDITVADIGAHQAVLIASVEGVLKPRLAVLRSLAAQQADFCLIDHLTAAATMSNAEFADTYDANV